MFVYSLPGSALAPVVQDASLFSDMDGEYKQKSKKEARFS